jgi:ADP-heptose:LPS heptosyltransferase
VGDAGRREVTGGPLLVALRALGLGDLLTGVPALRALARAFPDHRRVLVTTPAVAPLARSAALADEVVEGRPLEPLPIALHGADVLVNLHGRGPQSHRVALDAGPRRLVAFANAAAGVEGPSWRAGEHEVVRWCRLLAESGIPADPADLRIDAPTDRGVAAGARGATLVHPGAASGARRWPAERWAEVVRCEVTAGRPVVVTGGPDEIDLAQRVAAGVLPAEAVLAGRTDVLDLAAVVAVAGRVVCADTGVAHLATALGRPSVVLFGPTPPAEWGPPALPQHVVLWAGSRGDPLADEPDPGLLALGVEEVVAALRDLP